ncbi:MAG: chitobiase/beta-hexosaminidase C-terminal domain-containing protein [Oscillospiraceae bacterium]|nr:chitobiase/beta-hexosaminidase C-terminal domain-containing protein [Oscillospiraceae bacterium]
MKKLLKLLALLLVLALALSLPAFAEGGEPESGAQSEESEAAPAEEAAPAGEPEEPGDGGEVSPLVCGAGETMTVSEGAVICAEGGVVYNNGAAVYNNGGVVYNNLGFVYNNAGTTFNNSGTVYVNGGEVFNNAGTVVFNDGRLIDNAAAPADEAPAEEAPAEEAPAEETPAEEAPAEEAPAEEAPAEEAPAEEAPAEEAPAEEAPAEEAPAEEAPAEEAPAEEAPAEEAPAEEAPAEEAPAEEAPAEEAPAEETPAEEAPSEEAPVVDREAGVCPAGTTLTLSAGEGAVIRYTLDGSEPDEQSETYAEPIVLEKSAVLTACAWYEDGGKSAPLSADYTVPAVVGPVFEPLTQGYRLETIQSAAASVTNDGTQSFTVKAARLSGVDGGQFFLTWEKNVTLAPGETNDSAWVVKPRHKLPPREYNASLILILEGGETVAVPFSMTVEKA